MRQSSRLGMASREQQGRLLTSSAFSKMHQRGCPLRGTIRQKPLHAQKPRNTPRQRKVALRRQDLQHKGLLEEIRVTSLRPAQSWFRAAKDWTFEASHTGPTP